MRYNKKAFLFFKVIISSCLIAWIVLKVDLNEIIDILSTAKIPFILIAVLWLLLDRIFMSYRWNILLMAKQIEIPFFQIVKIYFLGTFSGNFLPSSVAPDAIRTYLASKYNPRISDILSSVLVDRVLGLFSLAVIALFSLLFIFIQKGEINIKSLLALLGIFFLIAILIFSDRLFGIIQFSKIRHYLSISEDGFFSRNLEKLYYSCNEYKKNLDVIIKTVFVSLFIQVLSVFVVYVLSLSVNIDISILHLFVFIPLINVLIMLPVSIGGIGLQEGAFIYFFSQIGVSSQESLTVAILFRAVTILVSLPGGVIYVMEDMNSASLPFK